MEVSHVDSLTKSAEVTVAPHSLADDPKEGSYLADAPHGSPNRQQAATDQVRLYRSSVSLVSQSYALGCDLRPV